MAATFDRDTLLDLVVNVIPLVIILFFVVAFALVKPFGGDSLGRLLQFGLLVFPFLALAILTYVSGKVIAADERRAETYHQGQATMDDAVPRHAADHDEPATETAEPETDAAETADVKASETADSGTDETDAAETADSETTDAEASETDEDDSQADPPESAGE